MTPNTEPRRQLRPPRARALLAKLTCEWTDLHVVTEIDVEPNIFAPAVRSFELGFTPR